MEEWTLVDLHGNSHTRRSWFLKCGDPYPATGIFFAPPTNEIRKDWHFLGSFSFSFWLQHCLDLCLMSFWVSWILLFSTQSFEVPANYLAWETKVLKFWHGYFIYYSSIFSFFMEPFVFERVELKRPTCNWNRK